MADSLLGGSQDADSLPDSRAPQGEAFVAVADCPSNSGAPHREASVAGTPSAPGSRQSTSEILGALAAPVTPPARLPDEVASPQLIGSIERSPMPFTQGGGNVPVQRIDRLGVLFRDMSRAFSSDRAPVVDPFEALMEQLALCNSLDELRALSHDAELFRGLRSEEKTYQTVSSWWRAIHADGRTHRQVDLILHLRPFAFMLPNLLSWPRKLFPAGKAGRRRRCWRLYYQTTAGASRQV